MNNTDKDLEEYLEECLNDTEKESIDYIN